MFDASSTNGVDSVPEWLESLRGKGVDLSQCGITAIANKIDLEDRVAVFRHIDQIAGLSRRLKVGINLKMIGTNKAGNILGIMEEVTTVAKIRIDQAASAQVGLIQRIVGFFFSW
ncbi:MAG: hypothetical protein LBR79_00880 [Oscillospiraceae bacterium]|nr:hypothetical protein [Oscillospiraceae bacterium]